MAAEHVPLMHFPPGRMMHLPPGPVSQQELVLLSLRLGVPTQWPRKGHEVHDTSPDRFNDPERTGRGAW